MNSFDVVILDDEIPKIPSFIARSIYSSLIPSDILGQLVGTAGWAKLDLKNLLKSLLDSPHSKNGRLKVVGGLHPNILLNEIDSGFRPNIVVYDWEYLDSNISSPADLLIDIFAKTNAFVFVYSKVRDQIPTFLNDKKFKPFSSRFQLFLKGQASDGIFSAEEYIYQNIVSRISPDNPITVGGISLKFIAGYLKVPADLFLLEKIVGRKSLLSNLAKANGVLDNSIVESILKNTTGEICVSRKSNFLIDPHYNTLLLKFKPEERLSYLEAVLEFGVSAISDTVETGIRKV